MMKLKGKDIVGIRLQETGEIEDGKSGSLINNGVIVSTIHE